MTLGTTGKAPYAPGETVWGVMERYRSVGLTTPIDATVLQRAGVSDSLVPRTLAALRMLDLLDDEGNPTDQFSRLKNAPTPEYPERLAEWLRAVYQPVFQYVDPSSAPSSQVEDAFRGYEPSGQRGRMVTLFLSLCEKAGIVESPPSLRMARTPRPKNSRVVPKPKPVPPKDEGGGGAPSSSALQRYLDMLIARAEQADELDADLLDRIERALAITPRDGS